jgi:hypothetical protein
MNTFIRKYEMTTLIPNTETDTETCPEVFEIVKSKSSEENESPSTITTEAEFLKTVKELGKYYESQKDCVDVGRGKTQSSIDSSIVNTNNDDVESVKVIANGKSETTKIMKKFLEDRPKEVFMMAPRNDGNGKVFPVIHRNTLCACGSGKKFRNCCKDYIPLSQLAYNYLSKPSMPFGEKLWLQKVVALNYDHNLLEYKGLVTFGDFKVNESKFFQKDLQASPVLVSLSKKKEVDEKNPATLYRTPVETWLALTDIQTASIHWEKANGRSAFPIRLDLDTDYKFIEYLIDISQPYFPLELVQKRHEQGHVDRQTSEET